MLIKGLKFAIGGLLMAFTLIVVSCASIDKTLDKVDSGLDKADATVDRLEETIDKADKTAGRLVKAKDRIENKGKNLATRVENIVHTKRHLVSKGDTLWGIASKVYSGAWDPRTPLGEGGYLWPLICEQNNISECDVIEIGDVIRYLPADRLTTVSNTDFRRHLQTAFDAD